MSFVPTTTTTKTKKKKIVDARVRETVIIHQTLYMIHDIKHDVNNDENDNDDAHIQIYETMTQHLKTSEDVKTVKLGRRNNFEICNYIL